GTGKGAGRARTCFTSCSPRFESGSTDGTTESHVPVGEANRTEAWFGAATGRPPMYDPVIASTRATPESLDSDDAYAAISPGWAEGSPLPLPTTGMAASSCEEKLVRS